MLFGVFNRSINNLTATVVAVGTDVMTKVGFTRGLFYRQGRTFQTQKTLDILEKAAADDKSIKVDLSLSSGAGLACALPNSIKV